MFGICMSVCTGRVKDGRVLWFVAKYKNTNKMSNAAYYYLRKYLASGKSACSACILDHF